MPGPCLITYRGKTLSIRQWSRYTGINPATLRLRFHSGKPLHEVFKPVAQVAAYTFGTRFDDLEPGQKVGNLIFLRHIRGGRVPKALFRSQAGWLETFTKVQFEDSESTACMREKGDE